jgi:hypothetical protein
VKSVAEPVALRNVAPVLPVLDLDAALERFRRLGFGADAYDGPERYGFVRRGDVSLHVAEWSEHDPARTGAHVYLYVSDANALHAEWAAAGVDGRLSDPHDTPYGLREFAYVDADGNLLRVGSPLAGDGA